MAARKSGRASQLLDRPRDATQTQTLAVERPANPVLNERKTFGAEAHEALYGGGLGDPAGRLRESGGPRGGGANHPLGYGHGHSGHGEHPPWAGSATKRPVSRERTPRI